MKRVLAAGCVSVILLTATAAGAQNVDRDVQCLVLSNVFNRAEKDPVKRQMAGASAFYYLGRVNARLSNDALRAQLLAQGKSLNAKNAGPLMTTCAQQVQATQKAMQALALTLESSKPKK